MIPVFDGIPIPSFTVDVILITLFLLSFFGFVFKPNWKLGLPVVVIYVFWVLLVWLPV